MNGPARFLLLAVLGSLIILSGVVFFTVREDQQALVLQFGAPVGEAINKPGDDEAGLKVKLPWQNVLKFDRKNLEFDLSQPLEIIVRNEERLLVDAFVRYQIIDPLTYFQTLGAGGANEDLMRRNLNSRLTQILSEAMREQLGSRTIRQIIDEQRPEIMRLIARDVTSEAQKLGVRTIDVRIRQADFPEANAARVHERMRTDYNQQAELIRAQGRERAQEIRAEANKEVIRIQAEANETSQIIRGRADAIRNCIFANAYQGVAADIENVIPATPEPMVPEAEGELNVEDMETTSPQPDAASDFITVGSPEFEEKLAEMIGVTCQITGDPNQGDPRRREFFSFYRSLTAYEQALGKDDGTTIILSPDSEFFQYFNTQSGN